MRDGIVAHPVDYRYGSPEMRRLFSPQNIYRTFALVELAVAEAQAELGVIPAEVPKLLKKAIDELNYEEVAEEEKRTFHDLVALINVLARKMGRYGEYVHYGLTSSDVKDTGTVLILKDAISILKNRIKTVIRDLLKLAEVTSDLPCVARTHGVHANVYLFGLKFAIYADELARCLVRFDEMERRLYVGKLSGAVGIHTALGELGEVIEERALRKLGLKKLDAVTQVIPRDLFAELIFNLALVSTILDKIATEIRNLQRTEISEVEEPFRERSQVGSSAMPHKRNPILCENISGLARMLRSLVLAGLENVVLWHERDLAHSGPERVLFPEAFLLLDEQLIKMHRVLSGLRVRRERVVENIWMTRGLIFSEALMMALAKGIGRQKAHKLVRELCMESLRSGRSLMDVALSDERVRRVLSEQEIRFLFEPQRYLSVAKKRLNGIIRRVKGLLEGSGSMQYEEKGHNLQEN